MGKVRPSTPSHPPPPPPPWGLVHRGMHVCSFVAVSSALKHLVQTCVCKTCLWTCVDMYVAQHNTASLSSSHQTKLLFLIFCNVTGKDAHDPSHTAEQELYCSALLFVCTWGKGLMYGAYRVYKPKAPFLSNSSRILWGFDHTVKVGALPVAMFANGHVFFNQKLYEVCTPNPSTACDSVH